jgi:hypothetical protein
MIGTSIDHTGTEKMRPKGKAETGGGNAEEWGTEGSKFFFDKGKIGRDWQRQG